MDATIALAAAQPQEVRTTLPLSLPRSDPEDESSAALGTLAKLVEEAEALEAAGMYRQAAELTAQAMTQAHADYMQSHLPACSLDLLGRPSIPMPRRDYIERRKAKLLVDWKKWDRESLRMSRRPLPAPTGDAEDDDDEEEEEEEEATGQGAESPPSTRSAQGGSASSSVSGGTRGGHSLSDDVMVDDWTPDTLAMQEAAGKIELVHTCCDGTRISASTVPRSDLPERLSRLFNRDPKKTVRGLLAGDSSVCPPTGLRWVRDSSADANGGRPTDGTAFHHKALAEALASRVEFSEAEWQSFGVQASEPQHEPPHP